MAVEMIAGETFDMRYNPNSKKAYELLTFASAFDYFVNGQEVDEETFYNCKERAAETEAAVRQ